MLVLLASAGPTVTSCFFSSGAFEGQFAEVSLDCVTTKRRLTGKRTLRQTDG